MVATKVIKLYALTQSNSESQSYGSGSFLPRREEQLPIFTCAGKTTVAGVKWPLAERLVLLLSRQALAPRTTSHLVFG